MRSYGRSRAESSRETTHYVGRCTVLHLDRLDLELAAGDDHRCLLAHKASEIGAPSASTLAHTRGNTGVPGPTRARDEHPHRRFPEQPTRTPSRASQAPPDATPRYVERGFIVRANFDRAPALDAEDRELADLLAAVLVDPNLHTDRIMRLHREVRTILRAAPTISTGRPNTNSPHGRPYDLASRLGVQRRADRPHRDRDGRNRLPIERTQPK